MTVDLHTRCRPCRTILQPLAPHRPPRSRSANRLWQLKPPVVRANPRRHPEPAPRRQHRNPRCRKTFPRRPRSTRSRRGTAIWVAAALRRFPKGRDHRRADHGGPASDLRPEQSDLSPASIDSVKQLTASVHPATDHFQRAGLRSRKGRRSSTAANLLSRAMAVQRAGRRRRTFEPGSSFELGGNMVTVRPTGWTSA